MAEKGPPIVDGESTAPPNPLLSVLSKFTEIFNFRFPSPTPTDKDVAKVETESKGTGDAQVIDISKPVAVRFPDAGTTSVPPLKLESDEVQQDTNPVVLWQVYAIGGFFVMKWAIARWKERRANKKKPSNEASPPPGAADE